MFQSGGGFNGQSRRSIMKLWDHCSVRTKRVHVSTICWFEVGLKNLELDLCKAPQHGATTTIPDCWCSVPIWMIQLDSFSLVQSWSHLTTRLFWGCHLARPWGQLQVSVELQGVTFLEQEVLSWSEPHWSVLVWNWLYCGPGYTGVPAGSDSWQASTLVVPEVFLNIWTGAVLTELLRRLCCSECWSVQHTSNTRFLLVNRN